MILAVGIYTQLGLVFGFIVALVLFARYMNNKAKKKKKQKKYK